MRGDESESEFSKVRSVHSQGVIHTVGVSPEGHKQLSLEEIRTCNYLFEQDFCGRVRVR